MDVGSEEREQLHREGQVQPGGGFPAPVCSQARGVATPPPPRCGCLSGNSRTKPSSVLVGAVGFGKSDSVSLLSGEWNFVVTP